jgi:hypothetical protein
MNLGGLVPVDRFEIPCSIAKIPLSFPKIPCGLDSHRKAESSPVGSENSIPVVGNTPESPNDIFASLQIKRHSVNDNILEELPLIEMLQNLCFAKTDA